MKPHYDYGEKVRLIRNVRNDGTYPGLEVGEPLIKRGSCGHIQSTGTYLQEYIIYSVHFLEEDILVGCKEEELISEDAPWNPSQFEFREKVMAAKTLSIDGDVIVAENDIGEVTKVLMDLVDIQYHIRFPGRTLQVPESALKSVEK